MAMNSSFSFSFHSLAGHDSSDSIQPGGAAAAVNTKSGNGKTFIPLNCVERDIN
jgi:hypothetical protein